MMNQELTTPDLIQPPPFADSQVFLGNQRAMAIFFWHKDVMTQLELFHFCQIQTQPDLDQFWLMHELRRFVRSPEIAVIEGNQIEEEYRHRNIQLCCMLDPAYPIQLKNYKVYPPILAVQGKIELLQAPQVAMVGSRILHEFSETLANIIADHLMLRGFVITSGGALGIDALSHRQAMARHAQTIVVTGTGPDECYPRKNKDIFKYAAQNGAIVSQYPINTPAKKLNFPSRNAIIAGLSVATVIIQCREKSGALYTANFSNQLKRPVFVAAMPGFDPSTDGGLNLVKSGKALLLSHKSDLDILGTGTDHLNTTQFQRTLEFGQKPDYGTFFQTNDMISDNMIQLTQLQSAILTVLKAHPTTRELLRQKLADHPMISEFDEQILELELMDCIETCRGQYEIKPS